MPRIIPIPDDFAANAHRTKAELAQRYGVSLQTVLRWRKRVGCAAERFQPKAMPEDFAEIGGTMSVPQLQRHYGVGQNTIMRWRKECGIRGVNTGPASAARRAEAPADLADRYRELGSLRALTAHYRRDFHTVQRWVRDAGLAINPVGWAATLKPKRRRAPEHHQIRPVPGAMVLPAFKNVTPPPLGGREEGAAQFLRRHYVPVCHCNEAGAADPKGKFWRCGSLVLSGAELLERAQRKGWEPDAWRELAA